MMNDWSPMNEILSNAITIRKRNGLPVEYSCPYTRSDNGTSLSARSDLAGDSSFHGLQSIVVSYAYEFGMLDPGESMEEVLLQDLASLEFTFLYLVAKSTSLLKCDVDNQIVDFSASYTTQHDSSQVPYLVSLSSDPVDEIASADASCTVLVGLPKNWICIPMVGKMTVGYYGSDDDQKIIENFILHILELEVANGTVHTEEIQKVSFLGQQPLEGAPSIGSLDSNKVEPQPRSSDPSNVALAASLSVGIAFVMVVLFAAIKRRRQSVKEDSDSIDPNVQAVDTMGDHDCTPELDPILSSDRLLDTKPDEENPPLISVSSTMTTQTTIQGKTLIPATSTMTTVPTTNTIKRIMQANPPKHVESSSEERQGNVSTPAAEGASNIDATATEQTNDDGQIGSSTIATIDILPPKPPGSTASKLSAAASKSIKVSRKKKKKKKQKLVRTNSREQISEMETITEEKEDPVVEDGSEYSYYSTDDDDSRAGSRENSPARSNSRSREPSPSTRSRSSVESMGNVISTCGSSGSVEQNHILETIDVPFPVNVERDASQPKRQNPASLV